MTMKVLETVTFGGSGLDRAAELRPDADRLRQAPEARTIAMWRGKPLVDGEALSRLPMDHPALALGGSHIFLGREDGTPIFATDVSSWKPEGVDADIFDSFLDTSAQTHPDLPPTSAFLELRSVMTQLSPRDAELAATARAVLNWHRSHRFCSACGAPSEMAMGGWERVCASCGAKHFPRTDPVVIMLITHGDSVLIGRSPGWPEGMYSLLAGFVEPGETIEAAVRREVMEEANVKVGAVRYLASQPWPFPNSLMFGCAGEALSTEITIDPVELEDALWVTRDEMADAFAGKHPRLLPAREGAIAHYLLDSWLAKRFD